MRFLVVLFVLLIATPAFAHTRSQSSSHWSIEGDALNVRVEAQAVDVTRLYALGLEGGLADVFAHEARETLAASANGRACTLEGAPRPLAAGEGRIVVAMRYACPRDALNAGEVEISSRLFQAVAPSHLHFVSLRGADGASAEAILTETRASAELTPSLHAPAQGFWETLARFLPIGAEHVWGGIDHVAFMLALLLLTAGGLRNVLIAATGFTLGHTATLGLAALGILNPDGPAVEALIGFTIAFVALEAGARGEARMRAWSPYIAIALAIGAAAAYFNVIGMAPIVWIGLAAFVIAYPRGFPRGANAAPWLALIFGLIHGCGFAGALSELDLPRPRLLASLAGFNLGVEFGQLTVIGGALLVAWLARRVAPARALQWAPGAAGALLFALGLYWFAGRTLGG
ncbi:MAG: HupE/UreJ family protein [Hyphomonadaceae bacterium]